MRGRCPRCASGRLFEGFLTPARECEACGLDFRFIDSGDGPAVLVIMVVGFVTVGLALWAEVALGIPLWLHFVLWPMLAVALSLPLLRLLKGAMIGQQFARSAAEGRVSMRGDRSRDTPARTRADARADIRADARADVLTDPPARRDDDGDGDGGGDAGAGRGGDGGGDPPQHRPRDEPDRVA